ncbi:hypothetical protein A4X09_0g7818, partial [Tilletia walkeri]
FWQIQGCPQLGRQDEQHGWQEHFGDMASPGGRWDDSDGKTQDMGRLRVQRGRTGSARDVKARFLSLSWNGRTEDDSVTTRRSCKLGRRDEDLGRPRRSIIDVLTRPDGTR